MRELRILEEVADLWCALEERWRSIAAGAIEAKGVFTAALSGGSTPRGFYSHLGGRRDLPWGETEIFQVDERHVPRQSGENNFAMIESSLLGGGIVEPRGVHSVKTEEGDAAEAALRYENDLRDFFGEGEGGWPSFDLVLLGIGEDGHTASLFPGSPEVEEEEKWVTVAKPAAAPHERITLTLPVLNRSRHAIFLATGRRKAGIVRRVWEGGEDPSAPASLVRPQESLVLCVDRAAGACP